MRDNREMSTNRVLRSRAEVARRHDKVWWTAFLINFFDGIWNAATGGFWFYVALLNITAAILAIVSRKRYHRRMEAMYAEEDANRVKLTEIKEQARLREER